MMKILSLLLMFIISILSNGVFAYSGCREIYREYDTKIWEKYNINIGNGNNIYLVLRCSSDCYTLSMGGYNHGSATLCGTKKTEGSWSYNACGEGSKFAPYGTDVVGVGNLMLSQCGDKRNRKINRKNEEIHKKNKNIEKRNRKIIKGQIKKSDDLIKSSKYLLDLTNTLLEFSSEPDKKACLKLEINGYKKAISKAALAKKKYRKALRKENSLMRKLGNKGNSLYNAGVDSYNIAKSKKCENTTQRVSIEKVDKPLPKNDLKNNSKLKFTKHATVFDPVSNIRISPNGKVLCKVKIVKEIDIKKYNDDWYSTNECGELGVGVIHKSQIWHFKYRKQGK